MKARARGWAKRSRAGRVGAAGVLAGALFLAGCGGPSIDSALSDRFQSGVRGIAQLAASGDSAGAMARAADLQADVTAAHGAGELPEERRDLISLRIDAVIEALEEDAGQSGEANQAPTSGVPTEELPAGPAERVPVPVPAPATLPAPAPAEDTAPAPATVPAPGPSDPALVPPDRSDAPGGADEDVRDAENDADDAEDDAPEGNSGGGREPNDGAEPGDGAGGQGAGDTRNDNSNGRGAGNGGGEGRSG
ncbi:hypothetical protein [Arthrobacter sp. Br18]|uniref:hypothetical protein n=1 Tax=Arthrobacter sp. Br18 TaxID=1312954 RepID=UPI00047910AB|nr:hypothetical protein [Arthrobacter sp. Br18]